MKRICCFFLFLMPSMAWAQPGPVDLLAADVSVNVVATPNPSSQDNPVVVTATVTNLSLPAAQDVHFTLQGPPGTKWLQVTGESGWTCTLAETQVGCDRTEISSQASVSVQATVVPPPNMTRVIFHATARAMKTSDPNEANNQQDLVVTVEDPVRFQLAGGGLGCQAGAMTGSHPGTTLGFLAFLGVLAAHVRTRLRQNKKPPLSVTN